MNENTVNREQQDATRAEITFSDGRTRTITSSYEVTQNGYGYDGGTWGSFHDFRTKVEHEVHLAQQKWGLPEATIKYIRVTRVVETVKRTITSEKHYRTRMVALGGGE